MALSCNCNLQRLFISALFVMIILLFFILYVAVLNPVVNNTETGSPSEEADGLVFSRLALPIQETQPVGIHPSHLYKQKIKEMKQERRKEESEDQELSVEPLGIRTSSESSSVPEDVGASDHMTLDSISEEDMVFAQETMDGEQESAHSSNDNSDRQNGDTASENSKDNVANDESHHYSSMACSHDDEQNNRLPDDTLCTKESGSSGDEDA